ncbi:D-alanyl-D-alanine carboxypeptidase/D-alanyl-D-alanine endopeptidase [Enemella sp. A6]|uniref:D-alanyl-D-alanine carboxypeptidase/D-alanyl-D-alanine endopeptidase n=1 Tax=Enemella sp. A6 TaxID=3440152 RepID=UPI003EB87C7C
MTRRRVVVESFIVAVVIVAVVALMISGVAGRAVERGLYATGLWVPVTGETTVAPSRFAEPEVSTPTPSFDESPVAPVAPTAAAPDASRVRAAIAGIGRDKIGGTFHVSVVDLGSGTKLYSENGGAPAAPASTMKVLTSVAALQQYGVEHRFTTKVMLEPTPAGPTTPDSASPSPSAAPSPSASPATPAPQQPPTIVLVGGGDPYLNTGTLKDSYPAPTIGTLAESTAKALQARGITTVRLKYDDSLFTGPAWNPTWPSNYADQVTPVSALTVNQGRVDGSSPGERVADPSATAAAVFVQRLKAHGITVSGAPARGAAPDGSDEVATLESLPLGEIVEHLMRVSDNDAAEILMRHTAIARGKPGSFEGGRAAIAETMTELGAWSGSMVVHDGSGLSRDTRITTDALAILMRLVTTDEPRYRPVMTGMPVGGVDGSLRLRYVVDGTTAGRGQVRAKTGTLRQVHSLAGYVRSADGSLIGFAMVSIGAKDEYAARTWLEKASAAMASCGCG